MSRSSKAAALAVLAAACALLLSLQAGRVPQPCCAIEFCRRTNVSGIQMGLFDLRNTGACAIEVDIYGMYYRGSRPDSQGPDRLRAVPSFGTLQAGASKRVIVAPPGLESGTLQDKEWTLECRYRAAEHTITRRLREIRRRLWERFPDRLSVPTDDREIHTAIGPWIR